MASSVQFSKPIWDLFSLPPSSEPETIPPLNLTPFYIPADIYRNLLDYRIPLAIAFLYASTVSFLNSYNRQHGNKPWAISQTLIFTAFVVIHNTFLAIYSGWTFLGMLGALQRSVLPPYDSDNFVRIVDSLCKIHGPSGLGKSVVYNATTAQWVCQSNFFAPDEIETPNLQSPGRIWNEGLAFYGWIFYLSKFYEVFDTLIILAKGKSSGILQTYHHTGAMLCMWAGIRFMSPPIWMFVFVNSAIHTLMYTYFTLTALNTRVPQFLKQSLTAAQILQILVGASYAAIHSFTSYSYLYEIPFVETVLNESASTTVSSIISVVTSNPISEKIKNLLITSFGRSNKPRLDVKLPEYTKYVSTRTERININCLDTNGQNFAVWLNVFYLIPLMFLFVNFFVNAYFRRSKKTCGKVQVAVIKSIDAKQKS